MGQDKGETVTEAPNIGQLKLEYQRALVGEAVLHEVIEKQRVRQEQLLENLRATYEGKHVRVSGPIIAEEQKAYNGTRDMFVVEDKSVVSFEGIAGWVSLERRGPTARIFGPSPADGGPAPKIKIELFGEGVSIDIIPKPDTSQSQA